MGGMGSQRSSFGPIWGFREASWRQQQNWVLEDNEELICEEWEKGPSKQGWQCEQRTWDMQQHDVAGKQTESVPFET